MARLTRQSAPKLIDSPSTTAANSTANSSPVFSTVSSSAGHDTPPTSDDELPVADDPKPAPKRRASARQVYVEVETRRGKGKTQAPVVSTKSKGKGKAPARAPVESSVLEGLDFDEDAELDESDGSGSEFVDDSDSDDAMPLPRARRSLEVFDFDLNDDDSDDDEAIMVDAAITMSLQRPGVASSSSSRPVSTNSHALLRARAAEARLAAAKRGVDNAVDDSQMDIDVSDLSSVPDSDDNMPLAKGKAKGGKRKKKVTVRSTPKKSMTTTEMRQQRREGRLQAKLAKRPNHLEEKALSKELGRKLTYVSLTLQTYHLCSSLAARLKNPLSPYASTTPN
ncbi:hypothetical protein B0H17DRAFT_261134 [Mycena rosella]|uniref:Uncharacterized protein n=1 Tax=Mycena rosella TaxID=1033263 RepID=A0AAD7G774_MYCRO|nr:hypothetical protein B0H17DRAFT_261134 [Mycena rosella]